MYAALRYSLRFTATDVSEVGDGAPSEEEKAFVAEPNPCNDKVKEGVVGSWKLGSQVPASRSHC